MTSADVLLEEGAGRPRADVALASAAGPVSYAALDRAASRFQRIVAEVGVGRGQPVVLVGGNQPWLIAALLGVWRAGAVAVPVSARLRTFDLSRVVADSRPVAVISAAAHQRYDLAAVLRQITPDVSSIAGTVIVHDEEGADVSVVATPPPSRAAAALDHDIAAVLYTSGTTGEPKGALLRHDAVTRSATEIVALFDLTPADTTVLPVPATHAFGFACVLAALAAGGATALVDASRTLEPLRRAAEEQHGTVVHGSPLLFATLARSATLPGTLRRGFVAGAACPPAVIADLDARGLRLLNLFGMTELGIVASPRLDDPPDVRHHTVGTPLCGYRLRTVAGELRARGPNATPGYLGRAEATRDAFDDGWFRTGDVAEIAAGGTVRILGRAKEVAHVAGFSVHPAEVEAALLGLQTVAQAAVVSVTEPGRGDVLVAFVVPAPGAALTPAAVTGWARGQVASFKVPYRVHVVDALPLLATGKPDRDALREQARERVA